MRDEELAHRLRLASQVADQDQPADWRAELMRRRRHERDRLLLVFSLVGVLPALLFLVAIAYEDVLAPPVLQYRNPVAVLTPSVAPGEIVVLDVIRCANDPLAPELVDYSFTREMIDADTGTEIALPGGGSRARRGCAHTRSELNQVPRDTPPGHYYIEGRSIAAGRFKTSIAVWTSDIFSVQ